MKRRVFEAFSLTIRYDRAERLIEISATVSEALAKALENAKDLQEEAPGVTQMNIAGLDMSLRATLA